MKRLLSFAFAVLVLTSCSDTDSRSDPLAPHLDASFSAVPTTVCDGVEQIPRSQCEALVALYNSTDGDNWTTNAGWFQSATPCPAVGVIPWHGVQCAPGPGPEAPLTVAGLRLGNNNLTGSIPPEIAGFPELGVLALHLNSLIGPIPTEIQALQGLSILGLSSNMLDGEIPAELGSLAQLSRVFLNDNQLQGPIPVEISNLTKLRVLWLHSNLLSGPLSFEVAEWAATMPGRFELPTRCQFVPPGNEGLFIPYAPEFVDLDPGDNHICGLPIATHEKIVGHMHELIQGFLADGLLNKGVATSLAKQIDQALTKAQDGKVHVSLNVIQAFVDHVVSLYDEGKISFAVAEALVSEAFDLRELLSTD